MPSNSRMHTKSLINELQTRLHLNHHISILRQGLIIHDPWAAHESKLSVLNKSSHFLSHLLSLISPPSCKEVRVWPIKLEVWVLGQSVENWVEYANNLTVIRVVVLVPTSVCVGMTYEVNFKWFQGRYGVLRAERIRAYWGLDWIVL